MLISMNGKIVSWSFSKLFFLKLLQIVQIVLIVMQYEIPAIAAY